MKLSVHHHQQGFAAIAAIFLVVILAAMGAFMVSFSNTQQLTSAQDVQGTRVYWAARAGLEVGISKAIQNVGSACKDASGTAVPTSVALAPYNVQIDCTPTNYADGDAITVFQIKATACTSSLPCTPNGIGYVERSVSASVCRLQAPLLGFC